MSNDSEVRETLRIVVDQLTTGSLASRSANAAIFRPGIGTNERERGPDTPPQVPRDVSDGTADGPVHPGSFSWAGQSFSGLAPKPYRAVCYLWSQGNRTAPVDDLAEPVWEDHEMMPDNNAIGGLRRQINRFFRKHGIPFHAAVKNHCILLRDGPPSSGRRGPRRRLAR